MEATFFATPREFRRWLAAHHASAVELCVGFYKTGSGRPSITWPESVDEALCVGWIDGVRRSIDEASYMIRFTPRRPRSTWSAVNIGRVAVLIAQGRMRPAGLKAFAERTESKSRIYAYEQGKHVALDAATERQFRLHRAAWEFFQAQPAWYRRTASWWVMSAKKEATRAKRLATLIEASEAGRPIRELNRKKPAPDR